VGVVDGTLSERTHSLTLHGMEQHILTKTLMSLCCLTIEYLYDTAQQEYLESYSN
jgi:hypothetical protein